MIFSVLAVTLVKKDDKLLKIISQWQSLLKPRGYDNDKAFDLVPLNYNYITIVIIIIIVNVIICYHYLLVECQRDHIF